MPRPAGTRWPAFDLEAEAIRLAGLLAGDAPRARGAVPARPVAADLAQLRLHRRRRQPRPPWRTRTAPLAASRHCWRVRRAAVRGGGPGPGGVAGGASDPGSPRRGPTRPAPSPQETDWGRIVGLYDVLGVDHGEPGGGRPTGRSRSPSATAPRRGSCCWKTIVAWKPDHGMLPGGTTCAWLGHTSEAAGELHTALTLAPSEVEQRLLQSLFGQLRRAELKPTALPLRQRLLKRCCCAVAEGAVPCSATPGGNDAVVMGTCHGDSLGSGGPYQ